MTRMLYTAFIMKFFLSVIVLTSLCLVLPACRKHVPPAEGVAAQNNSETPIKNSYQPDEAAVLAGDWKGILQIKQTKLRVVLHIKKQADGSLLATLDSLDQYMTGLPANAIEFTSPNLKIQWQNIGGTFEGALESEKLSGTWRQGAVKIPLIFERQ